MQAILENWEKIALAFGILTVAAVVGIVAHYILFKILKGLCVYLKNLAADLFIRHCRSIMRWLFILTAVRLVLPALELPQRFADPLSQLFALAMIALFSVTLIKLSWVLNDYIISRFDVAAKDNLSARKIHTQLSILRRIFATIVIVIAVSTTLMTFDRVRSFGAAILASAGIVSIIIGIAAQKTIGTLIAGSQIAITQPIRIDDVVIVENEWGRVEEITLTYVVVKIWDLRRLIVPINYFVEKPFQNWTRVSADLLGTVFIYADYSVPVEAIRDELRSILEKSHFWDKKYSGLQVTDAANRAVELRALVSAADSSNLWDLRCEVREKLIAFIQKNYPSSLPKLRAELEKPQN
jgi:small-conductance mechanosensitive channel